MWASFPGESKHGTENLKRHLVHCKKRNFRDIGQLLLDSRYGSLGNRHPNFTPDKFGKLMASCIVNMIHLFNFENMKVLRTYFLT